MTLVTRFIKMPLVLAVLLMAQPLTACALSGGPLEGKVLEEGTNRPISGAIVVARWEGYVSIFPAETRNVCVHVASTTTDDQGRYHFPAWRKEAHIKGVKNLKPLITAHHPGYQWSERYEKGVEYLKPFTGTREERLGYLQKSAGQQAAILPAKARKTCCYYEKRFTKKQKDSQRQRKIRRSSKIYFTRKRLLSSVTRLLKRDTLSGWGRRNEKATFANAANARSGCVVCVSLGRCL